MANVRAASGMLLLGGLLLGIAAAPVGAAEPCTTPGARPERGKTLKDCPPPAKLPSDRLDPRLGAGRDAGTMRFGDTEVRIGGRASFSAGYAR